MSRRGRRRRELVVGLLELYAGGGWRPTSRAIAASVELATGERTTSAQVTSWARAAALPLRRSPGGRLPMLSDAETRMLAAMAKQTTLIELCTRFGLSMGTVCKALERARGHDV